MWRSRLLKLGFKLNDGIDKCGAKNIYPLAYFKHKVRNRLEKNPLQVKIDGQPIWLHNKLCCWEMLPKSRAPFAIELFRSAIKPGATVLDIGAHVGVYSLIASREVGPRGRVYAFEPAIENFSLLMRNANDSGHRNIVCEQKAIAERKRSAPFFVVDENLGMNGLRPNPLTLAHRAVSVECISVDEYLNGTHADIVKMDIEGYEPLALAGMQRLINASKSILLLTEMNPMCLSALSISPKAFIDKLESLGFEVRLIDEKSRMLKAITDSVLHEAETTPGWFGNLYCTKGSDAKV